MSVDADFQLRKSPHEKPHAERTRDSMERVGEEEEEEEEEVGDVDFASLRFFPWTSLAEADRSSALFFVAIFLAILILLDVPFIVIFTAARKIARMKNDKSMRGSCGCYLSAISR